MLARISGRLVPNEQTGIPVDEVNRVVPRLISKGKITRVGLGVQIAPEQLSKKLDLKGVLILGVQPGGPAEKAGLRPTRKDDDGNIHFGDLIVAIDGQKIESVNQLLDLLEDRQAGDSVQVTILRDGQEKRVTITLEALS